MARSTRKRKPARSEDESSSSSTHDTWKGSITFGLVEIPVALVSADVGGGIKLSYLDKRNFSPVGYERYNKADDREVKWADIVHGYEYEKGKYVALGKEELKSASPVLTQTIRIEQFVDQDEIELIYFDRPYYLEPLKAGSKSYALLRQTLESARKLGVARVVVRTRERMAVVGVGERALLLYVLRYPDELRAPDELDHLRNGSRAVSVSAQEVRMAERLVADMSGKFDPGAYDDGYQKDLMNLIREKIRSGETHTLASPERAPKAASAPGSTTAR